MTENQLLTTDEEDELYEHHRIVVDRGQTLMRIDQYLKHHLSNVTRTKLQNAIETESVKVNEKAVKSSYKVKPFDIITVSMPHPRAKPTLWPKIYR